jgi:protein TonB
MKLLSLKSGLSALIGMALLTFNASAQKKAKADPNQVYTAVEQSAEFPGGQNKFASFLAKTIHYPAAARKSNVQGKVFVTFVVEKDGSLDQLKVVRGIGAGCDQEAVRALAASPKWKPGKQDGRVVRQQYTVPINFSLVKA